MLLAFVTLAAAAPPPGVDLDDLDHWEARAAEALAGPPGCWVLEGEIGVAYTAWSAPSLFRRAVPAESRLEGTFTGRLEDGVWTSFRYTLAPTAGGEGTEVDLPIWPLVGRIDPDVPVREEPEPGEDRPGSRVSVTTGDEDQALNMLHRALELIDPATTTAYAEWREDDGGVRLVQDVPMSGAARADTVAVATFFPDGAPLATAVDVVFPRKMSTSRHLVRVSAYDAQMHLRGHVVGERVVPAKENVSLGFGAFGFTIGYEQQLTYRRATACSG